MKSKKPKVKNETLHTLKQIIFNDPGKMDFWVDLVQGLQKRDKELHWRAMDDVVILMSKLLDTRES